MPDPLPPRGNAPYWVSAAVCAVLIAAPFAAVTFPPITDLPQLLAQVNLFLETVGGSDENPYEAQWLSPNKLGYAVLLVARLVVDDPLAAGRLGVVLIGGLWVAALHLLAWASGRPAASAALASILFWSHLTYWGILNFVAGFAAFTVWFLLLERLPREALGWRDGAKLLAAAALLYWAHALWLAGALVWFLVTMWRQRLGLRRWLERLAWTSPVLVLAALWYPRLVERGFVSDTYWGRSPIGRLHPEWLLNSALGGLEGRVEPVLALALLGWLGLGVWQGRRRFERHGLAATHRGLWLAGGLFTLAAICLPGVRQSTIFFASRWLPMGAALLVLACPLPDLRPILRRSVPYVLLASLAAATAAVWIRYEDDELAGLAEALAALPAGEKRVLGLDFLHDSPRIKGFPYYHLYAYSQVLSGGALARSFADLGSSPVVYQDLPRKYPWTEGLDFYPSRIRKSDMVYFQYVIISGGDEVHGIFLADPRLVPLTSGRLWRLYRVEGGPAAEVVTSGGLNRS